LKKRGVVIKTKPPRIEDFLLQPKKRQREKTDIPENKYTENNSILLNNSPLIPRIDESFIVKPIGIVTKKDFLEPIKVSELFHV
jgi:hypothetical protein